MLQLSVETIWRYTRNKRIPYIQLSSRQYRYDPSEVMSRLGVSAPGLGAGLVCEARPEYMTNKVYTYDDYLQLPDGEGYHYEILDGMLVREPAPYVHHQRVSRRLQRLLEDYFASRDPAGEVFDAPIDVTLSGTNVVQPDLGMLIREPAPYVHHQRVSRRLQRLLEDYFASRDPAGEVFDAPIDVTLSGTNVVQPDLIYIPGARSEIVEEARIDGAPYLVVEILSKWTRSKDRVMKRNIYERMQVPHYWVVDPEDEAIEAYTLRDGAYVMRSSGLGEGEFVHPDFPGFAFDLAALWKRPGTA